MSYFPSPYPEDSLAIPPHRPSHPSTPRQDTPVSVWQEAARPRAVYDASGQFSGESEITWSSEEPRGLGLLTLPVSQQGGLPMTTFDSFSTTSAPYTWPDHFQYTSNIQDVPLPASQPPWNDNYDAFAPVLPPTVWEDMTQSSATIVENSHPSPGETAYSTSSAFSCASSPYVRSDGIIQPAGSPAVKVEDHASPGLSPFRYIPATVLFDESKVVNPEELVTTPSSSIRQPSVTRSMPPTPYFLEVKPVPSQSRPVARRAYSTEDARIDARGDRQKRGFTTPEDSTCSCHLCGKMFKRSYNLKAHMPTHDPNRPQSYCCSQADCAQRFARRTDLLRHHRSVHLKERPYHCHLCSSSFSRTDTLRRHVEDGCAQRPEMRRRPSRLSRRAPRPSTARRASNRHFQATHLAPSPLRQRARP